jgi:hypothetical protein
MAVKQANIVHHAEFGTPQGDDQGTNQVCMLGMGIRQRCAAPPLPCTGPVRHSI